MSRPLCWRPREFFYPLGNTLPFCLTQYLSPDQDAAVLLLGCGDPRNILFTLYADASSTEGPRKLDFTCCETEPAVLARNILLFTLIEDNISIDKVWEIFYHFKLDNQALDILIRQSKKLYNISEVTKAWRPSSYGPSLKFVDSRTLSEVRRYWKHYVDFPNLSPNRLKALQNQQSKLSSTIISDGSDTLTPSQSAGMMWREATKPMSRQFIHFWKTGTCSVLNSEIQKAKNLNPTWCYSRSGEVFFPHDCTFPLGFHFSAAFAPLSSDPTKSGAPDSKPPPMDVAKRQFKAWCEAFKTARAANSIIIRHYTGDELAFCRALDLYNVTGKVATTLYSAEWSASRINLDEMKIGSSPAPTKFHAIDTANLVNHLGLLNLLVATRPIMEDNPMFNPILYTEEVTTLDQHNVRPFLKRLSTSVPTLSALVGLAPLSYVSGLTTYSNVHEAVTEVSHTTERVSWVDPARGDSFNYSNRINISLEAGDLVNLLFDAYKRTMFLGENLVGTLPSEISLTRSKMKQSYYYDQSSMAAFFQLVKRRVHLKNGTWETVIKRFLDIVEHSPTTPWEKTQFDDLLLQLHLHGIYTADSLKPNWQSQFPVNPRPDMVKDWSSVPPALCVVLTVPRERFIITLQEKMPRSIFKFQCNLRADGPLGNSHTSIRCIWGKCVLKPSTDKLVLQEDIRGADGDSDLIVWFWAPTQVLAYKTKTVGFALYPTSDAFVLYAQELGASLEIFTADVEDKKHVRLLTYSPTSSSDASTRTQLPIFRYPDPALEPMTPIFSAEISLREGQQGLTAYNARVEIDTLVAQDALLKGAKVKVTQISPCTMRLYVDEHIHVISYPYPVLGTPNKLRVARKSHYIEVIVAIGEPLGPGGYVLDRTPVLHRAGFTPWNVHRINLERLPILDTKDAIHKLPWLCALTALQLSDHERAMMAQERENEGPESTVMAAVKDTIHTIVSMHTLPEDKQRVFGFCESNRHSDIYAMLLISGIRLDLASYTIAIDAAIIPFTEDMPISLKYAIDKLLHSNPVYRLPSIGDESTAIKKMLPAFVERARTWRHTSNCEYIATANIPVSVEYNQSPICSCGAGIGFNGPEWHASLWKPLLPFATRIAVCPIFSVTLIDPISQSIDDLHRGSDGRGVNPQMANRMQLANVSEEELANT
ncbi:MYND Zn-finger protein [Ceratobasidium sp. AG-Ba]|nr:MYND Zn-finger protein [Ceratobasidium sp. AG-Ba]QRW02413.1 MYND Zn-finger protein [Ceratobasidium sp. AG-Ba]